MRATAVSSSRSRPMYPTLTFGSSSSTGPRSPRPARSTGIATTSLATLVAAASASGVRTVPPAAGRSQVASYRRNVIAWRASERNSSGVVAWSRSPARQCWTTGWRLTCSATISLDEPAHGVHGDLDQSVHGRGVRVVDLAGPELVHAQQDDARTPPAERAHHQERRRLHVVGHHAGARPHCQLGPQLGGPG